MAVSARVGAGVVEDLDAALRRAVGPLVEAEREALRDAVLAHAVAEVVVADVGAHAVGTAAVANVHVELEPEGLVEVDGGELSVRFAALASGDLGHLQDITDDLGIAAPGVEVVDIDGRGCHVAAVEDAAAEHVVVRVQLDRPDPLRFVGDAAADRAGAVVAALVLHARSEAVAVAAAAGAEVVNAVGPDEGVPVGGRVGVEAEGGRGGPARVVEVDLVPAVRRV